MELMRSDADLGSGLPFNATPDGLRFLVRLTPRASRNGFDGLVRESDGRPVLRLRVTAAPVKGAANAALVAFVANALNLRKSDVRIVSGQTARLKLVELSGNADLIAARLMQWIGASDTRDS
jgi:uncharacterized protein YggU (UPF0235/DUF167 family)